MIKPPATEKFYHRPVRASGEHAIRFDTFEECLAAASAKSEFALDLIICREVIEPVAFIERKFQTVVTNWVRNDDD